VRASEHLEAENPAAPLPPPPPLQVDSLSRPAFLARAHQPSSIDWRGFLRLAAPLGVVVGFFTPANPLAGALVLLPASVFLAVHLYRRRHPLPLNASQGAKLGAMVGFFGFVLPAAVAVVVMAYDPEGYRKASEDQMRQVLANTADPQVREFIENLVSKAGGVIPLTVAMLPVLLAFLLAIGGVSGAVAASLPRGRSGP
jgi:hypothetical protein